MTDFPPSLPPMPLDPHGALAVGQDVIYRAILSLLETLARTEARVTALDSEFHRHEEETMAISTRLQAGFDRLSAQFSDLDTDVDAALQAANTVNTTLRDQIMALESVRDGLQAQVGADAAEITRLNDVIASLTTAQQTTEVEIASRLDAISSSVDAIDSGVPGGSQTTPGSGG